MSVLCGNDYLPKVRGFRLEWAWNLYIETRSESMFPPTEPLYGMNRHVLSHPYHGRYHIHLSLDGSKHQINIKFLSHILDPQGFINAVKPRKVCAPFTLLRPFSLFSLIHVQLEEEKNPKSALNVMIQKFLEPAVALNFVKEETAVEGGYSVVGSSDQPQMMKRVT